MTYEEILAAFESIDYETILSAFDDKLTLLEWLTKLNDALVNNAVLEIQYLGYQNNSGGIVYAADFELPINNHGNEIKQFIENLKSYQTYEFDNAINSFIKLIADVNGLATQGQSATLYTTGVGSYMSNANTDKSLNVDYCFIMQLPNNNYTFTIHGIVGSYNADYTTSTRQFATLSTNRHQTRATYLGFKIKNASGIIFTKQFTGARTT